MATTAAGGDEIRIGDLTGHELIGEGACGAVFRVKDPAGRLQALKILNDAVVNHKLVENTTSLLRAGDWPDGVMPVTAMDLGGKPAFLVSPLMADDGGDGTLTPRSLQHRLDRYPGPDSWKTVRAIARALAAMHARHVPHGNLKPGNVFFDDSGGVLLRDWALGHMPGTGPVEFTDALLYQPPAQLRDPAAYSADGFRCDVFAFGVLAFRLLTGTFPRCHASFSQVAPPSGKSRTEGIRADLEKVAANLEAQRDFNWPDGAPGQREAALRGWIDRCLALDPGERPRDMGEVAAGFGEIDREDQAAEAVVIAEVVTPEVAISATATDGESSMDERRHAGLHARRMYFGLAATAAAAVFFAALWAQRGGEIDELKTSHAAQVRSLESELETVTAARSAAEVKAMETAQAMVDERDIWVARLKASQIASDRLFSWLMEQDHRRMPPLDGRGLRLKFLQQSFEDFAKRLGEEPELVDELALARLRLAEISLSLGDHEAASSWLAQAARIWDNPPLDPAVNLRLATARLWLALVLQEQSKADAAAAFVAAREALAAVPRDAVDTIRLDQLMALLDLHESQLHAARGDETRALEQLMRATQALNRVAVQRPDSAVLRSELATCHLATATIMEGIGNPGDALEVRAIALAELRKARESHPDDPALLRQLAAAHVAMAEASILTGDIGGAEVQIREAEKMLASLPVVQSADSGETVLNASLLGLRAGMLRDRGQADEALKLYDQGIGLLEGLRASAPADSMPAYRLALLWWQKGRLLGDTGKRDEEIELLGRARDLLDSLAREEAVSGPLPEQVRRAAAYLAGDLGHALQIANRKGDAARAFDSAVSLWENLAALRPGHGEYQEGLTWSRQRRQDLE